MSPEVIISNRYIYTPGCLRRVELHGYRLARDRVNFHARIGIVGVKFYIPRHEMRVEAFIILGGEGLLFDLRYKSLHQRYNNITL